ncbi:hypothetical protein ACQKH5_07195 [Hyphomonas sp. NPDC076900]|uniref:hypothetical protein n=1 Tax=Hyphomonas sp. NPDC076900 TaxID=3390570 RepID=UPI003D0817F6
MDEKFVIVEVLTSADYYAAAEALRMSALEKMVSATEVRRPDVRRAITAHARKLEGIAQRFENVAAQVREQEAKTHGL